MENNNPTNLCKSENCAIGEVLIIIQKEMKRNEEDTKAGFAKFERKQDQILEVLGDYKVLLSEIRNLKSGQERLEEQFIRESNNSREENIAIFQRLNDLEKTKADKTEMKEGKGWLWGLVIMVITILANFVFDLFRGHLGAK